MLTDKAKSYLGEATPSNPKYPSVAVSLGNLAGPEGNAFCILGRVENAMRRAGKTREEIKEYLDVARSGDYRNLLAVTFRTVFTDVDAYSEEIE